MAIDFNKFVISDQSSTGPIIFDADSGDLPELEKAMQRDPSKIMDLPAKKFDMEAVKKSFAGFEKQIDRVKSSIEGFEIKTDADAGTFTETVGVAKSIIVNIENRRKAIIKDPDAFVRSVNTFVRKFRSRLEDLERKGKQKIGEYNYKLELKRREDEKKMQEEAAKRQAAIDKQAADAGVESISLPPITVPKKVEPIRTDTATGSTRYKKKPKVVDFAKLPDEYKMVDEKALQAAIDAGLRPAGVEIEEIPIVSIRKN